MEVQRFVSVILSAVIEPTGAFFSMYFSHSDSCAKLVFLIEQQGTQNIL
jgi:hypothetical protein